MERSNMEGNNNSKRIKPQIVVKQEEGNNLPDAGPTEAMELVPVSTTNYFTPQIMDVWPKILGYVTDPKDVFSVMNSAPVFQSLLQKRKVSALLPLVLPILMKKKHLEADDILNCRLVSKSVKVGVDDALVEQRPLWLDETYQFTSDRDADRFQDLLGLPQDFIGNPFLLRRVMLGLEKARGTRAPLDYVNVLWVLKRFGHELYDVDLTVEFKKDPYARMRVLKQSLSCLPNVKKLTLVFAEQDYDAVLKCNNFRNSRRPFPVLQHLEDLDLDISYMKSYDHDFLTSFVRPILQAYRKQITRLHCESYVFKGTNWESFQFPQLRQLDVYFDDPRYRFEEGDYEFWISETIRNVAKLECPHLESLTLRKRESYNPAGLIITRETFEALNKFRSTLKTLILRDIEEGSLQLFQVDPANIREFPQMTTLKLSTADVGTEWMHLFRVMFTKLEEIHFEQHSWRYSSAEQSLEKIRNDYFAIFPNLKRIIWSSGMYFSLKREVLTRRMKF